MTEQCNFEIVSIACTLLHYKNDIHFYKKKVLYFGADGMINLIKVVLYCAVHFNKRRLYINY